MHIGINAHLLAFTENYRQAGLSRYVHEMVTRVPSVDRDACFTAFVGNGPIPRSYAGSLPPNVKLSRSRLPTVRAPMRIAWEQTALPLASLAERLDLLHCPVNVRPIVNSCPVVVTVHDLAFLRYPRTFKPAKRLYLKAMTTWSCRHAAHVIAVSEATRRDVVRLVGVSPRRVTAIPNGVGEQFTRVPEARIEEFRAAKGVTGRVVLFVGTLEPRKNLGTLIRAFAALAREETYADVTLVIGGSKGWYYEEVFATAEGLGLTGEGRVRFLGRVPDDELPILYNSATVFVYPSVYEGFGLPVLEAMACGTPAITSNTSSLPEVAGDAGLLVEPGNTGAWTAAMRTFLDDTEAARLASTRGMARAREFSWDRTARRTAGVYRQVLSGTA